MQNTKWTPTQQQWAQYDAQPMSREEIAAEKEKIRKMREANGYNADGSKIATQREP